MSIFSRRQRYTDPPAPPAPPETPRIDLAQALDIVLVKSVESQASVASKISELVGSQLKQLSELQISGYERSAKRRAGKARAKNAIRAGGRFIKCRLCHNPAIPDPTAQEIMQHTLHHQAQIEHINAENPGMNYREENGTIRVDADEASIQRTATGDEVIECEDCAQGKPHSHVVQ